MKKIFVEQIFKDGKLLPQEMLLENMGKSFNTEKGEIIMSELFISAINSKNTQDLIKSNERLSESNEEHQISMNRLTYALVFVGIVQAMIYAFGAIMQLIQVRNEMPGLIPIGWAKIFVVCLFGSIFLILVLLLLNNWKKR